MTSKILRSDGVTELSNIKSVIYTETVNAGEGLRPGCVASSSINVECFGSQSDAPAQDEALTYYQVVNGVETLVGTYHAEPSIPSKGTYKFVAYDAVAKLDVDFSARLNAIQNDFPMTVYDLVSEACSVAGVTLGSSSWPLGTQTVQAFYADNLTCRNILQYAAEIACRFVRCDTSGEVIFDWYTTNSTGIYPGGNEVGKVAYKQNGLTYDNTNVYVVDSVAIKPSGVEGAAYIYPTSYSAVTASDPNSDGNIILTNLIASDLGNGELLLSVEAEDDNTDGNVEVGTQTVTVNPMIFSNNLLLTNAAEATYLAVAQNIYDTMSALPSYRHSTTQLFVDENPFHAGEFVSVTDAQGVSFTTPVFTMTVSASGATLQSSGKAKYQMETTTSLAKTVANLASNIVQFNTKVVFKNNLTDGETVISGDNIQTGTIESANGATTLNLTNGEFTFGRNGSSYGYLANGQLLYRKEGVSGDQSAGIYLHPWLGYGADGLVALLSDTDEDLGTLAVPYFAVGIVDGSGGSFVPGYVLNNGLNPNEYPERNLFYGSTRFVGPVTGVMKDAVLLWRNPDESTFAATTIQMADMLDYLGNYNYFVVNCHQTNNSQGSPLYIVTRALNMKDYALYDDNTGLSITARLNIVDTAIDSSWKIIERQRTFVFDRANGTVTVSTGYYSNNGTSGGSYASTMVPISIYGMNI